MERESPMQQPPRSAQRVLVGIIALLPSLLGVHPALAQAGAGRQALGVGDEARADELFFEGRRLLEAKQYDQACDRFRQSLALKRSPGILLNVGDCLVRENAPAAALDTFEEAQASAELAPDSAKRT